jgi:hypothetical protein
MPLLTVAVALFVGCMAAGLAGLALRPRLAERHLDSESRAVVTNITGLIAAMSALLLSLLVANAQSSYNTVSDEVDQMAANLVELDRTLGAFGPAATEARALLRRVVAAEIDRIWPPDTGSSSPDALDPGTTDQARLQFAGMVGGLPAQTEAQRALQRRVLDLLAANSRTRVLVFNQLNNDLPLPVVAVVSSWLVTLFLAFGLLARFNAVVVIALLIGAVSVGGAMFLVLELNRPFGGIMQVSDGSMRTALALMGR